MDIVDGKRLSDFGKLTCDKNSNHVIGVVERVRVTVKLDGRTFSYHSPRLMIFKDTVDIGADIPKDVDVAGTIEGRTLFHMVWKCSVPGCGGRKKWHPEKELMNNFVKIYLAE